MTAIPSGPLVLPAPVRPPAPADSALERLEALVERGLPPAAVAEQPDPALDRPTAWDVAGQQAQEDRGLSWPAHAPELVEPPPPGTAAAALAATIAQQSALARGGRTLPEPDAPLEASPAAPAEALVAGLDPEALREATQPPAAQEPAPEPVVVLTPFRPAPFVPDQPPLLDPVLLQVPLQVSPEPRVSLGFRDGSTTALQPDSEQARALEELARLLTSSG